MIIYKDVFEKLEKANYSADRILEEGLIPKATLNDMEHGKFVNMGTIDIICKLLKCRIDDILEYIPDSEEE